MPSELPSAAVVRAVRDAIEAGACTATAIVKWTGYSKRCVWMGLGWLQARGYAQDVGRRDPSSTAHHWRIAVEPDLTELESKATGPAKPDRFSANELAKAWPVRVMLPPGRPRTPHHLNQD